MKKKILLKFVDKYLEENGGNLLTDLDKYYKWLEDNQYLYMENINKIVELKVGDKVILKGRQSDFHHNKDLEEYFGKVSIVSSIYQHEEVSDECFVDKGEGCHLSDIESFYIEINDTERQDSDIEWNVSDIKEIINLPDMDELGLL